MYKDSVTVKKKIITKDKNVTIVKEFSCNDILTKQVTVETNISKSTKSSEFFMVQTNKTNVSKLTTNVTTTKKVILDCSNLTITYANGSRTINVTKECEMNFSKVYINKTITKIEPLCIRVEPEFKILNISKIRESKCLNISDPDLSVVEKKIVSNQTSIIIKAPINVTNQSTVEIRKVYEVPSESSVTIVKESRPNFG